ncbi:hypothetical protein [Nocardia acidivorans]|uniref:hypothetical protein n=1 Tax=Nocardia acidivorans TaxID=404580 RepID=UPI000A8F0722|nr:hypothetical protein [Nocardia acidivorans]
MKTMRWSVGLAAAACAVALLSGCSEIKTAVNQGGDTKCSDYLKQDADTQRITITKFIKQQTNTSNEPAGTNVDIGMASVQTLCQIQSNADTPIKNADLAGIFIKK